MTSPHLSFATTALKGVLLSATFMLMAGCATGPDANPRDPLEPLNRSVYQFNDAVDTAVLKPVATAYQNVTPSPIRTGVGNFFGNLGDLWSSVNAGLQLRPREATYLPFRDAQGQAIDQGLALYFPAPHSYTGEDVLELQAHGGPVVLQLLLALTRYLSSCVQSHLLIYFAPQQIHCSWFQ